MTAKTVPLFLAWCERCHCKVRWINGRPEAHECSPFRDDAAATPWRVR